MKKNNIIHKIELWWFYLSQNQKDILESIGAFAMLIATVVGSLLLAYLFGKGDIAP